MSDAPERLANDLAVLAVEISRDRDPNVVIRAQKMIRAQADRIAALEARA